MNEQGFELFGPWHLLALALVAASAAAVPWLAHRARSPAAARRASLFLAWALILVESGKVLGRIVLFDWRVVDALPLHLCGIASYLTAIVLLSENRRLHGIVYFWAVGGTLQALLTPELDRPFPEPLALGFFASHGLVLIGVSHAAFGLGLRSRWSDIPWSLLALNAVALLLLPFNLGFGTNYFFLLAKPSVPTLLDHLGPWPWYLLACEAIALGQAFLWQLPWELERGGSSAAQRQEG